MSSANLYPYPDPFSSRPESVQLVEPVSFWNPSQGLKLTLGTGSLLASMGSLVVSYMWRNPIISTSTALASGIFAQAALELTPRHLRDRITEFNIHWSFATFLSITQVDANCSKILPSSSCPHVRKSVFTFLQGIGATWLTGSVASRLRRTKENDYCGVDCVWSPVEPKMVKCIEPNSQKSFWICKIARGSIGVTLITASNVIPSINYFEMVDDLGAFLVGDTIVTIATKLFWDYWQDLEQNHKINNRESNICEPSLKLKTLRIIATISDGLSRNVLGGLFIGTKVSPLALNFLYAGIGGIFGSQKFVSHQRFTHLPISEIRYLNQRNSFNPTLRTKIETAVKLTLATVVAAYLCYQMSGGPLKDIEALIAFGTSMFISYLATRIIDRQFTVQPYNRALSTLYFYTVLNPDYLALPFFAIDQQMKIGNLALDTYKGIRVALAIFAWASLGASVGNASARTHSLLVRREATTTHPISQFLWGQLVEYSYGKKA